MKPVMRSSLLIATVFTLGGCATQQPLYYWGSYQEEVYKHFKGEESPEQQIAKLEADSEKAASENLALPPGFQAHLALLYGSAGNTDKMHESLEAEKQKYPESSTFMDFLLKKFDQ